MVRSRWISIHVQLSGPGDGKYALSRWRARGTNRDGARQLPVVLSLSPSDQGVGSCRVRSLVRMRVWLTCGGNEMFWRISPNWSCGGWRTSLSGKRNWMDGRLRFQMLKSSGCRTLGTMSRKKARLNWGRLQDVSGMRVRQRLPDPDEREWG